MVEAGINTVRVYSVPPRWFLDLASQYNLHVIVGLAWEQHVAFLQSRSQSRAIIDRIRQQVSGCAGHHAILCYTVGNEIPGHIVRWYGHRAVEGFLRRLCEAVKGQDPGALVTYVNYPSTEYLDLPFIDFVSFNVYLETPQKLQDYLYRLQNIAGNRPLLIAELGLDSMRNGEREQADALIWQIATSFRCGAAGVIVFSWTDQWFRGGSEINDWAFGLTRRDRSPKPAFSVVREAYKGDALMVKDPPLISVVVCTYNGNKTLGRCLQSLAELRYPRYEVIVVDDGSTTSVQRITEPYDVRYIRTENFGLSSARNTGLEMAKGSIVAYIDDDAYADKYWLSHLAVAFEGGKHAGVGGPNIAPENDGIVADCVARAPGGPVHVLLTDQVAEHIPGCNMAFRTDALRAIGGFDARFRIAGDDVDICWRLQDRGWTLGFSPAAVVWHHRRSTVKGYWRQQWNYGSAEADLERKWPEKYNSIGHLTWNGRLYSPGLVDALGWWNRRRIYHGQWGTALFQSVYHVPPGLLSSLPAMPEWYLLIVLLPLISLVRLPGSLMVLPIVLALICLAISLSLAWVRSADPNPHWRITRKQCARRRLLTMTLFLIQPAARLLGRALNGLHPWRHHGVCGWSLPWPRELTRWGEQWQSSCDQIRQVEHDLRANGAVVLRGGEFDRWDLELRGGALGSARVYHVVEEHGQGRQLSRFCMKPHVSRIAVLLASGCAAIGLTSVLVGIWPMTVGAAAVGLLLSFGFLYECGVAISAVKAQFVKERPVRSVTQTTEVPHSPDPANISIEAGTEELDLVPSVSRVG